jgi:cell division transport system ATP-binding protein
MESNKIVELRNASIFQQNELILTNVNLDIEKGEFVYLIGMVGSGKSSIIKTLHAQIPLKVGEGNVLGHDLTKLKPAQIPALRRRIGVIFQDFQLLTDRNVFENLKFVLAATGWKNKGEIAGRIDEVLDNVGLRNKIHAMPHELSGGEQQRVVIARAILNSPELILADEPTGNLDPETSTGIIRLLTKLQSEKTSILMATHDYRLIDLFPGRTLQCIDGKVVPLNNENSGRDFAPEDDRLDP